MVGDSYVTGLRKVGPEAQSRDALLVGPENRDKHGGGRKEITCTRDDSSDNDNVLATQRWGEVEPRGNCESRGSIMRITL